MLFTFTQLLQKTICQCSDVAIYNEQEHFCVTRCHDSIDYYCQAEDGIPVFAFDNSPPG